MSDANAVSTTAIAGNSNCSMGRHFAKMALWVTVLSISFLCGCASNEYGARTVRVNFKKPSDSTLYIVPERAWENAKAQFFDDSEDAKLLRSRYVFHDNPTPVLLMRHVLVLRMNGATHYVQFVPSTNGETVTVKPE